MPFAEHRAPRRPGEDILQPPPTTDPRVKPWIEQLERIGVIDSNGIFLKPKGKMMRGVIGSDYIWRVDWEEPA